jgi:hypothetical protein
MLAGLTHFEVDITENFASWFFSAKSLYLGLVEIHSLLQRVRLDEYE